MLYPGYLRFASLSLLVAVACGAFGAHALKAQLSVADLAIWQTAVLYQFVHGLGLILVVALQALPLNKRLLNWSGFCLSLGTLIFSGSLYALVLTQVRWLGAITPVGGTAFLLGWLLLFLASWQAGANKKRPV